MQKPTLGVSIIFVLQFLLFFSPNDGSRNDRRRIGCLGLIAIGLPTVGLGNETFEACGIPRVLSVFGSPWAHLHVVGMLRFLAKT